MLLLCAVQARVAVLYSTGTFAVYDLDHSNELRPTIVTANLVSARLGRVADVEWLPLPAPVGAQCGGFVMRGKGIAIVPAGLSICAVRSALQLPKPGAGCGRCQVMLCLIVVPYIGMR